MNPVYTVLVILLVALSLGRYYVQRGELRRARAVAMSALIAASAALPPAAPPPRPGDERKRAPSPAFGTPIAQAPDAGTADGGGSSMLAAEPETRLAGELQAIDVEHTTEGFVVGAPLR